MARTFIIHTGRRDLVQAVGTTLIPSQQVRFTLGDIEDLRIQFTDGVQIDPEIDGGDAVQAAIGSCALPDSGTWGLAGGSGLTGGPATEIPHDATPEQLKAAIVAAFSSVSASDIDVVGGPGFYRVEFVGALEGTAIGSFEDAANQLSPRSAVSIFVKEEGGDGNNAVQIISLQVNPLAFTDDFTFDDGVFSGSMRIDQFAMLEAIRLAGSGQITRSLSIRVIKASGQILTLLDRSVTIDCSKIPPGAYSGVALPFAMTTAQFEALITSGELDMVVNSLVVDNPGLKTQSSVVALIDDGELIVPTPNTGNTLLIERDGGAGTTTVSTVSGLVPGAIYLLKNMDGGTLELTGALNDSDSVDLPDGKTCWLYADSETTGHIIGWHLGATA